MAEWGGDDYEGPLGNTSRRRISKGREPRWDIDVEYGHQAEMFVRNVADTLKAGSVEVKRDARALETGNLYVEYECDLVGRPRQPSGIRTTDADLYAFVLGDTDVMIVIPTVLLKQVLNDLRLERDPKDPRRSRHQRDTVVGSHPTRGITVSLERLLGKGGWLARYQQKLNRARGA